MQIIKVRPDIDGNLKRSFDRLLKSADKNFQQHYRFLKNLPDETLDLFMNYVSYLFKYDLTEYFRTKKRLRYAKKQFIEYILSIVIDLKDSKIWKDNHLKLVRGIYLGEMYQIYYKDYQHDPFPLVIFLNSYDTKYQNFNAINLHYLTPSLREYVVKAILKTNDPRIKSGKPPILNYDIIKKLIPITSIAYRNYKAEKIKVIEKISHKRWQTHLRIDMRKIKLQ